MSAPAREASSSNVQRGLTFTGLGGLLLSLDIPLIKLAQTDPSTTIVVRGIMIFVAFYVFWHLVRRRSGLPFLNGYNAVAIAVVSLVANIFFINAIYLTTAANVVFILACQPLASAVLSWFILSERIDRPTALAIFVALAGITLIAIDGLSSGGAAGIALAFGCAVLNSISLILVRRDGSDHAMTPAFGALLAAVLYLPFAHADTLTISGWGWLALNGMVLMPVSMAFLMNGPRYLSAAVVSLFFLLETVLTPVWMWMIFDERPTVNALAGGSIVLLTLVAHSLWSLVRSPRRQR